MTPNAIATLLVAALLAGCGSRAMSTQPMFGYLEIAGFDATATYDVVRGLARVEVEGSVRAQDTEGLVVEMYVVDRPCAMGPEAAPDGWLARQTQRPGDPDAGRNETIPYGAAFEVRVDPGKEYAAIAVARASNTIGPIFGACETLRAL